MGNYNDYLSTYNGNKLKSQHSLDEYGIWEVYGEDPNCDLGGHHHNPFLGVFEGTLEEVLYEAVELSGFWQWGYGGEIKSQARHKVKRATPMSERSPEAKKIRELEEAKKDVLAKVQEIDRMLDELRKSNQ
jgi:hypothetical protein